MFAQRLICSWIGTLALAAGQTYVQFPEIEGTTTVASSINENGEIVGTYNDGQRTHGFVRRPDGTFRIGRRAGRLGDIRSQHQ